MSATAPGQGRSDNIAAAASRTAAATVGTAALGPPGSGCGGPLGVGPPVSRPATCTGTTLPPSTRTPHGTAGG
ncbi:hypothetical protein ACPCUF_12120 [Streptomyces griseoincarnatus]